MSASNFNLRGIPSDIMDLLKRESKRLHTSVNSLILKMIENGLGFSKKATVFHDLDHLAGTWTTSEVDRFEENTRFFEKIDKDLWS